MKFCCENYPCRGDDKVKDLYELRTNQNMITYYARTREYIINYSKNVGSDIQYCPWCGKELPKELSAEWDEILDKEYNIKYPMDKDRKKVPPEFWTDEWWRKRNL